MCMSTIAVDIACVEEASGESHRKSNVIMECHSVPNVLFCATDSTVPMTTSLLIGDNGIIGQLDVSPMAASLSICNSLGVRY